jgi:hypothetical protein
MTDPFVWRVAKTTVASGIVLLDVGPDEIVGYPDRVGVQPPRIIGNLGAAWPKSEIACFKTLGGYI